MICNHFHLFTLLTYKQKKKKMDFLYIMIFSETHFKLKGILCNFCCPFYF